MFNRFSPVLRLIAAALGPAGKPVEPGQALLRRAVPGALFLTALDQASKWVVDRMFEPHQDSLEVIPGFFDVCHVVNFGASWGIFTGWRVTLILFAVVALAALAVFHKKILPPFQPLPSATLALLLGGITGNLIDRVRTGGVIDFIHLYWRDWSFPVFNIADTCITFGLVMYIAGQFVSERAARRVEKNEKPGLQD